MVEVLLFARARDLAGVDHVRWSMPVGTQLGDVQRRLLASYPALATVSLLAAVNGAYAPLTTVIADRAEIAFFPPVSGG
jgi:molybdopterin converting factor subunit 1